MSPATISYVLVTGATGFIGAHVVDELLRRGLKVRMAARSQAKAEQMIRDRPQYGERLEFVQIGDLTQPGIFDEAIKGVDAIIHTASPVDSSVTDNESGFIIPAITGTKSALEAAKKEPGVKRFILTSSFAAVLNPSRGFGPETTYTSEDWNPLTYEEGKTGGPLIGYRVAKKLAETAAWDFIRDEKPQFDLVTICPPMVYGPIVHPVSKVKDLNESCSYIWGVAAGANPIPSTRNPAWVDVRDVALAHVEALLRPEVSNQRFTISAPEKYTFQRVADILREEFDWAKEEVTKGEEGAPIPPCFTLDGEIAGKALGIKYRSFRDCVIDGVAQFKEIQRKEVSA